MSIAGINGYNYSNYYTGTKRNTAKANGMNSGLLSNVSSTSSNITLHMSGMLLSKTANRAAEHGLTGMEFAAGIPGSIGGAVVMNAGAYGGEMKDILTAVTVLDQEGNEKIFSAEELELGYRTSCILKKGYIVMGAKIKLKHGEETAIRARMEELKKQRVEKQPLEYPSAGSTFKRPEGYFAGKLIMDAGLRGYLVGEVGS